MNSNIKQNGNSQFVGEGVLGVSVNRAFSIDLSNVSYGSNSIKWSYMLVRFQLNNVRRESKAFKVDFIKQECLFNDMIHLQVEINRQKNDLQNQLKIELILIGFDVKNLEKCTKTLAKHFINVVDLVRVCHLRKNFEMKGFFKAKLRRICMLNIEFCFAYGQFGYGYSDQLKPKIDYYLFESPQEYLSHSMFQRIEPPTFR